MSFKQRPALVEQSILGFVVPAVHVLFNSSRPARDTDVVKR